MLEVEQVGVAGVECEIMKRYPNEEGLPGFAIAVAFTPL